MSAPGITQNDLLAFHTAHFSNTSSTDFAENFLGPVDEVNPDVGEDDGLGYYDDGVKRTLTDEQIAIFRHSEIQAILRKRRHAAESNNVDGSLETNPLTSQSLGGEEEEEEDGEVAEEFSYPEPIGPVHPNSKRKSNKNNRKSRKAQEAKDKGWFKQNIKPDLRKRTWDKVEKSVGTLAYDDDEGGPSQSSNSAPQRRRITYDDP